MIELVRSLLIAVSVISVHAHAKCPFGFDKTHDESSEQQDEPPLSLKHDLTSMGCNCTSECGASLTTGLGACDWCWTANSCGQWSLRGHWDYCVYPAMTAFEAQDHRAKGSEVWARVTAPSVVGKSAPAKSATEVLSQMVAESMITSFDDQWEVMPAGRSKVIHTQGVVCPFNLSVSTSSAFTGILAPGNQTGLIRMGSASSLDTSVAPHGTPMFPGFGIKFFRSGVRSADFVGLRTTGPGGSWNFFESDFANHVAPPPELVALHKFQQASGCIDMVGLSDVCTYTQAGAKVDKVVFPFETLFHPTGKVEFPDKRKSNADLLQELSGIAMGTELFDVYTYASPKDKLAGTKVFLGTLTTTEACHQSLFGDENLFFRHQRMEEDFALRPDWIEEMAGLKDAACDASAGPVSKWQCVPVPKDGFTPATVPEFATPRIQRWW